MCQGDVCLIVVVFCVEQIGVIVIQVFGQGQGGGFGDVGVVGFVQCDGGGVEQVWFVVVQDGGCEEMYGVFEQCGQLLQVGFVVFVVDVGEGVQFGQVVFVFVQCLFQQCVQMFGVIVLVVVDVGDQQVGDGQGYVCIGGDGRRGIMDLWLVRVVGGRWLGVDVVLVVLEQLGSGQVEGGLEQCIVDQ